MLLLALSYPKRELTAIGRKEGDHPFIHRAKPDGGMASTNQKQ